LPITQLPFRKNSNVVTQPKVIPGKSFWLICQTISLDDVTSMTPLSVPVVMSV